MFWIGANDKDTEGTFVWDEDGSPASVIYSWWDLGSPRKGDNDVDCAVVNGGNRVADQSCSGSASYFYLCMEPSEFDLFVCIYFIVVPLYLIFFKVNTT